MNMKIAKILATLLFTAALGVSGAWAETATLQSGKGERLIVVGNPPAGPARQAAGPHIGPIIEKKVVRQHAADSKKRVLHETAGIEQSMPKCRFSVKRDGASKETRTVMVHLAG